MRRVYGVLPFFTAGGNATVDAQLYSIEVNNFAISGIISPPSSSLPFLLNAFSITLSPNYYCYVDYARVMAVISVLQYAQLDGETYVLPFLRLFGANAFAIECPTYVNGFSILQQSQLSITYEDLWVDGGVSGRDARKLENQQIIT